jgi:DNA-binding transcriptional LysR family regulator
MDRGARLNLIQLATLLEFGRRGTLAAAAESLGYTPGAVSQHLASLERTVGTPLVRKTGRMLVLTDAGHVLLAHADSVLRTEREAMRAVSAVQHEVSGPLMVGTWGSTAATLLAPAVHRLAHCFPYIAVQSREVALDDAATDVLHGRVDVAFGLDYADAPLPLHDGVAVEALHQEAFSVATRAAEPGVDPPLPENSLTADDLAGRRWILPPAPTQYGIALRTGLRRRGIEPATTHEVTDSAASLHLASAGLGVTVITPMMRRLVADLPLRVLAMADPLTREVVLLVPSAHRRRPVTAFVDTAREVAAELPRSLTAG